MYTLPCASTYRFPAHDIYVLDLRALPAGLAALSSDRRLSLLSPERLADGPVASVSTGPGSLRARLGVLDQAGSVVATAAEDGGVRVWDFRTGCGDRPAAAFQASRAAVLSLACCRESGAIAVGTELQASAASIHIWDIRAGPTQLRQYDQLHSDDITELAFNQADPALLLSGSTDGLVGITDTRVAADDEDRDAVVETFNHGASIHRAGYLSGPAGPDSVFALSHDERFAVYGAQPGDDRFGVVDFGDLRQTLACQYVADVVPGNGAILGVGSQDHHAFKLVHLSRAEPWEFTPDDGVGLEGAHADDIIRAFCILERQQVIFTAAEDGCVKAWRPGREHEELSENTAR